MNESAPKLGQIVKCGDWLRFSVALLRQMYEEPDHESMVVELVEIRLNPDDGSKILVLERRDRSTWNKKWGREIRSKK